MNAEISSEEGCPVESGTGWVMNDESVSDT